MRGCVVVLMLVVLGAVGVAHAQDTWMSLTLDGRKVGHMHVQRLVQGQHVVTTTDMLFRLNRTQREVPIAHHQRAEETLDGQPLAFEARTRLSAQDETSSGRRTANGSFRVQTSVGGEHNHYWLIWPEGALLNEGQRLTMKRHGIAPGTHYRMQVFNPSTRQATWADMRVIGPESVVLPTGPRQLVHLSQTVHGATHDQVMQLWVNRQFTILKASLPMFGFTLEMLACDQACALSPDQPIDLLAHSMVDAPRPMVAAIRAQPVRYLLRMTDTEQMPLIQTDEQQLTHLRGHLWQMDVGIVRPGEVAAPDVLDTAPTPWLQSNAPAVRALAHEAAGQAMGDRRRMIRLKEFVHHYIRRRGLDVGYASALETVHSRQGDCTEHAVLLAALARALGIPARIVTGLVYVDRYAGRSHVFVPHAWVLAWIDGAWRSYDAIQGQFDSTHLAMTVGNGDPWHYFAAMDVLGSLRIERATPASELLDTGPPPVAPPAPAVSPGGPP
ncbi:transglutaminase-like domain-containing protein [Oleiagrimonas sp. C23AA]|uniref:transglutaminase-like domain-containing protein n=1 Tax=Oleiagrimonas sp. C23AA TaxID=2719047 RepID=UPI00141D9C42|nr:transglutaminase-like domain-containing protein [Oleiagrimonas sp. C23AA]NII11687.1 transglutaminase domain-containing protein [Oleiagrimonas sp. C23AA]